MEVSPPRPTTGPPREEPKTEQEVGLTAEERSQDWGQGEGYEGGKIPSVLVSFCFAARYRYINLSFFICIERSDLLTSQVDYNFLHKLIDKFFAVLDEVPAEGFITMEEVIYYVI